MRTTTRRRWALALAGALLALTLPMATAQAVGVYCARNGATLNVTMVGDVDVSLKRNVAGTILINSASCGMGTVTTIDKIRVHGDAANQHVDLWLTNGGFRPGLTNEPGDSDEIEIYLDLGTADPDGMDIEGSTGADNIRLGQAMQSIGMVPRMNLDADETTGIDSDLYIYRPTFGLWVKSGDGPDVISGAGGAGTGDPWATNFKVSAGTGADTITGGIAGDYFNGGPGSDELRGGLGDDDLGVTDGVDGNDSAYGGGGTDLCDGDPGDLLQSCEIT